MNVFDVVKILLGEVIFTLVVLLMAKKIKTNFKESDELVNNQRRRTVQSKLFQFALVPIFLCFIFLPYKGLNAFYSFFYFGVTNCSDVSLFLMKVTVQIFRVVTMVAASAIIYAAYVLLFSNLSKSFQCSYWQRFESNCLRLSINWSVQQTQKLSLMHLLHLHAQQTWFKIPILFLTIFAQMSFCLLFLSLTVIQSSYLTSM